MRERACADFLKGLPKQRAKIEEGKRQFPERAPWDEQLARLDRIEAAARRGDVAAADQEMEDFMLEWQRITGDALARFARSSGPIMHQIENVSDEKLAELSDVQRAEHYQFVRDWQEHKEQVLGVLPVEERRRIERGEG